jgi:serine/threonine protein kinase
MNKVEGVELFDYSYGFWQNFPRKRMSYARFIKIAVRIAKGIQIMHENGLVHLDLKIENIMINPETDKITIIDFGFACTANDKKCLSKIRGTRVYFDPHARSPKQSKNWGTIERCKQVDIWAFGVSMLRILHYGSVNIESVKNNEYGSVDIESVKSNEINELLNNLMFYWNHNYDEYLEKFKNGINTSKTLPKFLKKCLTFDIERRTKNGTELFQDVSSELCFNKIFYDSIAVTKGSMESGNFSNSYCFQLFHRLPEKHFLKKKVLEQLRTQKESEIEKLAKHQEFTKNLIPNLDQAIQLLQ